MKKRDITIFLILLSVLLLMLFYQPISRFVKHSFAVTFYEVASIDMTKARKNYLKNHSDELNIAMLGSWELYRSNGFILQEAIELAISEINAGGGVMNRQLNIIWYDDQNSSGLAQEYTEVISRDPKIFAVFGPLSSGRVKLLSPMFSNSGLIDIAPLSQSSQLISLSPNLYMPIASNNVLSKAMLEYSLAHNLDDFLLINNDGLFAADYANILEQDFFDNDLDIHGRILFDRDSKSNYIRNEVNQYLTYFPIKNVIYLSKVGDGIDFLHTDANEKDLFSGNIIFNNILPLDQLIDISRPHDSVIFPQLLALDETTKPTIKKFLAMENFQREFYSLLSYRAVYVLADAIYQAQSLEVEDIKEVLSNNTLNTPLGQVRFNEQNFLGDQNIDIVTLEELTKRWESME